MSDFSLCIIDRTWLRFSGMLSPFTFRDVTFSVSCLVVGGVCDML